MKNTIRFYYNLNIDEISEHDAYSIVIANRDVYAFKRVNISIEYLNEIMNVINLNNIKTNKIIINKDNDIITKYNGDNYILTLIEDFKEIDHFELLPAIVRGNEDTITQLWEKKIEYYLKQISEIGLGNSWLVNSFNYYIGMAENAISIYNRCDKNKVRYIVSHRRLNYPLTFPVFLDPTNMIIDVLSRDISEYVKIKFMNEEIEVREIRSIVEKYQLNNDEMNILLARLIYPSYYFDALDKFILKKDAESTKLIVVKINKYEKLLKDFYEEFKDYQLYVVDWIKK